MEFLEVFFPVSGVKTNVLLPPLVALVISFFTSMGGVSGAFLLLPFQMSVLGYTSPSVSGTNFLYNIVAIPSGVWRYVREGRMLWPLTLAIIIGTLPGVFLGYYIRIKWLPDPVRFKLFAGCVLLYIGTRLLRGLASRKKDAGGVAAGGGQVSDVAVTPLRVTYSFRGEGYSFGTVQVFLLALAVGVIGGAYGIGGGAIIAPFCVAVFRLHVYTVAGAALMGTLVTSVAGAAFYSLVPSGVHTAPDWSLGLLFGAGGFVGMYLGAKCQRYVPERAIKLMLAVVLIGLAGGYVLQFMRR